MGSDASKIVLSNPLVPQQRFPRVVNTRFMLDRVLTLRIPEGFWSHDGDEALEIRDVDTKAVMFKIPPTKPVNGNETTKLTGKQLLLDLNGVPIVTMENYTVGHEYATYVPMIPRPASMMPALENAALCYLETNNRPLENRLLLQLDDPSTGGIVNIRVDSSWSSHETMFWLDRGLRHKRDCIARVYLEADVKQAKKLARKSKDNSGSADNGSYILDIAPGVDVALIVLACAALDEELKRRSSGQPYEVGTDEITAMLAERHHGSGISRDRDGAKSSKALFVSTDL